MDARELREELQKLRDDGDVSSRLFLWLEKLMDFIDPHPMDPHEAPTKPDRRTQSSAAWSNKEVLEALEEGKKSGGSGGSGGGPTSTR